MQLTAESLAALAGACGDEAALLRAIDQGPPGGGPVWPRPDNAIELVASLVRQVACGGGASRQLGISPKLASWLDQTLQQAGFSPKKAMGGAGAFAANLAAVGTTRSSPPTRSRRHRRALRTRRHSSTSEARMRPTSRDDRRRASI